MFRIETRRRRGGWGVGLALAATLVLAGAACNNGFARRVRQHTYPPGFHYITQGEIETTMGQLAVRVVELDDLLLREEPPLHRAEQERIIEILLEMRGLARELKSGTRSNHPRIDMSAPRLQFQIASALHWARKRPPSYYAAGNVSGACTYCHARPEAIQRADEES